MNEFLDTSVIVRYLTADPPEMANRARGLIESDRPLKVSLVVLAEAGYVLTRHYKRDRASVVAGLCNLLQRDNLSTHEVDTDLAVQALHLCAPTGRTSFADALSWATANASAPAGVWTFDRRFPNDGISRAQP